MTARIDTLWLVAKLKKNEWEELKGSIDFEKLSIYWGGNKVWNYILHNKEPFFIVYFEPRVGTGLWTNEHYNIMVHMQHAAIKEKPLLLELILSIGNWRIKRLDIAFDWKTSMSSHFLLKPPNAKGKLLENGNHYVRSFKSEERALVYDKKKQLMEEKNVHIPEDHLTRLEVRIYPKLRHQRLGENLVWIEKVLKKFVFVPDASVVSRSLTSKSDKDTFRKVRRRTKNEWVGINDRQKKRIRAEVTRHSVDLFKIFLQEGLDEDLRWSNVA